MIQPQPQPFFIPDQQPTFRHGPLPSAARHIRLLILHAGSGDTPLSASLRLVEWAASQRPNYEALSYMWGPAEPKATLSIEGQVFLLRPNIHAFLKRLRHSREARTLWLDAVCIDQNNLTERNEQVSHMGEVYRSCSRCLLWLGNDIPRAGEVLAIFRARSFDRQGWSDLDSIVKLLYDKNLSEPFRALLGHEYWRRVWMLQETTLPANVVVHAGGSTCSLDDFPIKETAIMSGAFYTGTVSSEIWSAIFGRFDKPRYIKSVVTDFLKNRHPRIDTIYPQLICTQPCSDQGLLAMLGFRLSSNKDRWVPIAVDFYNLNRTGEPLMVFVQDIRLSTVSDLSFPAHNLSLKAAFDSIQSVFWFHKRSSCDALLNSRTRHQTQTIMDDDQDSKLTFERWIRGAQQWFCTDVRDRIFAAVGTVTTWPRVDPFMVDYALLADDLLLKVVDYCRPAEPFSLASGLLVTLNVDVVSKVPTSIPPTWSITSILPTVGHKVQQIRVFGPGDWSMGLLWRQSLPSNPNVSYTITLLRRRTWPVAADAYIYFTRPDDPSRDEDMVVPLGDSGIVLSFRSVVSGNSEEPADYSCVGIGFDGAPELGRPPPLRRQDFELKRASERSDEQLYDHSSVDNMIRDALVLSHSLPTDLFQLIQLISLTRADEDTPHDKYISCDWWISCPSICFWWFLARQVRRQGTHEQIKSNTLTSIPADRLTNLSATLTSPPEAVG
jgi:hypothetical protein